MTKSLKPKLRFKRFSDDWKLRKLKETILIERGGSPRPIEDFITNNENGLNWVKIGDAPEMGKYITKTAEKIKPEGLIKTREVYPGDLILSNSMSFGKPYIMAIKGCIHDGWLLLRNDKKIFDLLFLSHLLGTDNMLQQYQSFAAGSTVHNLNKELVGNTNVLYPKKLEQSKIGTFFDTIDNLITLQQRKLDKISNLKKAMLAKMFPKNGSETPEVRFKGFSDNWEQNKVNNLCIIGTGKSNTQDKVDSGKYPFYVRSPIIERSNKYIFDEEAVITVGDGVGTGKVYHYVKGKYDLHQRCYRMTDFSGITGKYFFYYFSEHFYNRVMMMTAKTSVDSVRLEMIANMEIQMPKNLTEQNKIATYFNTLDTLITLYQSKLEKLKNIKKSCLEKMFV